MKIFVVEDDFNIFQSISNELKTWNYEVCGVKDFSKITEEVLNEKPNLVVMDIILPYNNGYFWCSEIRKYSNVPIVFLSSKSENMDIVMAMQFGGDDYITKPFDLGVFVAKINAIIRRTYDFSNITNNLIFNEVVLNLDKIELSFRDKKVDLTKTEMIILESLFRANGNVVLREVIMEKCWNGDDYIDDNTLSVNITRLRKKLSEIGLDDFILTKKKAGYYLSEGE